MILALYEGFFQNNFRWLFKVIFFFHIYILSKLWNFPKKHKIRCERSLVVLPGCFWILEIAYHSAAEIVPFFCFFHFFSRSQIVWNSNFVNKKREKWYFFFNCDIFFLTSNFKNCQVNDPQKKNITYGTKNITLENFKNVPIMAYFGIKKGISLFIMNLEAKNLN